MEKVTKELKLAKDQIRELAASVDKKGLEDGLRGTAKRIERYEKVIEKMKAQKGLGEIALRAEEASFLEVTALREAKIKGLVYGNALPVANIVARLIAKDYEAAGQEAATAGMITLMMEVGVPHVLPLVMAYSIGNAAAEYRQTEEFLFNKDMAQYSIYEKDAALRNPQVPAVKQVDYFLSKYVFKGDGAFADSGLMDLLQQYAKRDLGAGLVVLPDFASEWTDKKTGKATNQVRVAALNLLKDYEVILAKRYAKRQVEFLANLIPPLINASERADEKKRKKFRANEDFNKWLGDRMKEMAATTSQEDRDDFLAFIQGIVVVKSKEGVLFEDDVKNVDTLIKNTLAQNPIKDKGVGLKMDEEKRVDKEKPKDKEGPGQILDPGDEELFSSGGDAFEPIMHRFNTLGEGSKKNILDGTISSQMKKVLQSRMENESARLSTDMEFLATGWVTKSLQGEIKFREAEADRLTKECQKHIAEIPEQIANLRKEYASRYSGETLAGYMKTVSDQADQERGKLNQQISTVSSELAKSVVYLQGKIDCLLPIENDMRTLYKQVLDSYKDPVLQARAMVKYYEYESNLDQYESKMDEKSNADFHLEWAKKRLQIEEDEAKNPDPERRKMKLNLLVVQELKDDMEKNKPPDEYLGLEAFQRFTGKSRESAEGSEADAAYQKAVASSVRAIQGSSAIGGGAKTFNVIYDDDKTKQIDFGSEVAFFHNIFIINHDDTFRYVTEQIDFREKDLLFFDKKKEIDKEFKDRIQKEEKSVDDVAEYAERQRVSKGEKMPAGLTPQEYRRLEEQRDINYLSSVMRAVLQGAELRLNIAQTEKAQAIIKAQLAIFDKPNNPGLPGALYAPLQAQLKASLDKLVRDSKSLKGQLEALKNKSPEELVEEMEKDLADSNISGDWANERKKKINDEKQHDRKEGDDTGKDPKDGERGEDGGGKDKGSGGKGDKDKSGGRGEDKDNLQGEAIELIVNGITFKGTKHGSDYSFMAVAQEAGIAIKDIVATFKEGPEITDYTKEIKPQVGGADKGDTAVTWVEKYSNIFSKSGRTIAQMMERGERDATGQYSQKGITNYANEYDEQDRLTSAKEFLLGPDGKAMVGIKTTTRAYAQDGSFVQQELAKVLDDKGREVSTLERTIKNGTIPVKEVSSVFTRDGSGQIFQTAIVTRTYSVDGKQFKEVKVVVDGQGNLIKSDKEREEQAKLVVEKDVAEKASAEKNAKAEKVAADKNAKAVSTAMDKAVAGTVTAEKAALIKAETAKTNLEAAVAKKADAEKVFKDKAAIAKTFTDKIGAEKDKEKAGTQKLQQANAALQKLVAQEKDLRQTQKKPSTNPKIQAVLKAEQQAKSDAAKAQADIDKAKKEGAKQAGLAQKADRELATAQKNLDKQITAEKTAADKAAVAKDTAEKATAARIAAEKEATTKKGEVAKTAEEKTAAAEKAAADLATAQKNLAKEIAAEKAAAAAKIAAEKETAKDAAAKMAADKKAEADKKAAQAKIDQKIKNAQAINNLKKAAKTDNQSNKKPDAIEAGASQPAKR